MFILPASGGARLTCDASASLLCVASLDADDPFELRALASKQGWTERVSGPRSNELGYAWYCPACR